MKKTIIGIIGEDKELIAAFTSYAVKHGFHCFSIEEKVCEIAKYLLPKSILASKENITQFRKRGYAVHRLYWVNMLLSSISAKSNRVLITDMCEEDCVKDVMKIYRLNSKNMQEVMDSFSKDLS